MDGQCTLAPPALKPSSDDDIRQGRINPEVVVRPGLVAYATPARSV